MSFDEKDFLAVALQSSRRAVVGQATREDEAILWAATLLSKLRWQHEKANRGNTDNTDDAGSG